MKYFAATLLMILVSGSVYGQQGFPVTPSNPRDFTNRNLGNSSAGVGIVKEPEAPKTIKVAYTAVSPFRDWKNAKGQSVKGSLIAFEAGDFSDSQQELTIVEKGKVRLLVEGKKNFSLVAMSSLSDEDQKYIADLIKARKEAAAAAAAAPEKKASE